MKTWSRPSAALRLVEPEKRVKAYRLAGERLQVLEDEV